MIKLAKMRGERGTAVLGDNKMEIIMKTNEMIVEAAAFLTVVCSQNR